MTLEKEKSKFWHISVKTAVAASVCVQPKMLSLGRVVTYVGSESHWYFLFLHQDSPLITSTKEVMSQPVFICLKKKNVSPHLNIQQKAIMAF